jgi:uncharacterized protein (TIGR03435 family)
VGVAIMRERAVPKPHIGKKVLWAILGSTTTFVGPILTGTMAKAQPQPASPLSFEVASIKANHSVERIMLFQPGRGGRFTATNCSLSLLIQYAYGVRRFQISGAPDWVKSDRYNAAAKAEGDPQVREILAMLQRLLEDRLQLKYHWDTKEAAVHNLVVSKAGKLRDAEPRDCPPPLSVPTSRQGVPPDDAPCGSLRSSPGHTQGYKLAASDLAGSLSFLLERSVLDKTALTGKYDIELQWTPESVDFESPAPSIFTALREHP